MTEQRYKSSFGLRLDLDLCSGLDIDLWVWPEQTDWRQRAHAGSALDNDLAFSHHEVLQLRLECKNEPPEQPSWQHSSGWLFIPLATKGTDVPYFFMMDKLKKHKRLRGKAEKNICFCISVILLSLLFLTQHCQVHSRKGSQVIFIEEKSIYFLLWSYCLSCKYFFYIFVSIFRQQNLNCYHCFNGEASHLSAECFDFIASLYIFPCKEQRASLFRCYIFHLGTFTSPPSIIWTLLAVCWKKMLTIMFCLGGVFIFVHIKKCYSIATYRRPTYSEKC